MGVPVGDPAVDAGFEYVAGPVGAVADRLLGEQANQRSTWLIQQEPVGVKCMWKPGRLPQPPGPHSRQSAAWLVGGRRANDIPTAP